MAYILGQTKGKIGTGGSVTVNLPTHAVDDVVFVLVSGLNNNPHTGPGGSWQTHTMSDPGSADTVLYYQRVVTAPLSDPSITWSGTAFDAGTLAFVVRGADVSTATSCIDTSSESASGSAWSVTTPALTLTDSNQLIVLLTATERATEASFLGAGQGTEVAYFREGTDFCIGVSYIYDQNTTSDTYTAYTNHTSTGGIGIYAIAIKDNGNGDVKGYAKAGTAADLVYFNIGDQGEAVTGQVDVTAVSFTPQITSITSNESSVAQTAVNDSFTNGSALARLFTEDIGYGLQSNSIEIPDLIIRGIEFTSTVDLSNTKLSITCAAQGKHTDSLDNLGRLIGFGDNTNASLFEYEGGDAAVKTSQGVQTYVIDTSATGYEIDTFGAGSLNWAAVKHVIHGWKPSAYSGQYVYVGALYNLGVMEMLGGSTTFPCSFVDAAAAVSAGALNTISNQIGQSGSQFFSVQDIAIGDGADDIYWNSQYESIEFPPAYNYSNGVVQVQADAGAYELSINVTAGSTVTLDTTTINMGNYHGFTIKATTSTSASYSFAGATILNADPTLNDIGAAISNLTFSGCKEIVKNACDLSGGGCVLDACVDTYCVTVTTQAEFEDLKNVSFTNNDYSIRITGNHGGATWSLAGATVSGGTGSYDIRYEGTGTLTVEADSGSGWTQVRAEATVGTLTISAPTLSLTVNSSEASSDIKIFDTNTQTIEASTTGTTVNTTATGTYDWTVQKAGFLPQRGTGVALSGSSVTVDVTLVADPVYSSSHGLMFTTDYSYNASTRVMTIVANQEGRDLYSALIDDFISETSLRNCPFPLVAVGPDRIDFAAVGYYNTATTVGATIDSGDIQFWKGAGMEWEHDTTGNPTKKFYSIKSANTLQTGSVVGYTQVNNGTASAATLVSDKVNEVIQFFEDTNGDGTPDYNYTGHLLFKGFKTGYYQARWDVINDSGVSTLEPYEYTINLLQDAIAGTTGDQSITITTLTDHTSSPKVVGSKNFDYELVDPGTNTAENLLSQFNYDVFNAVNTSISGTLYTSYKAFDLPDLIIEAGANYETERGYFEGDGAVTDLSGVYLSRSAADHPNISRFQSNDGTYYVPAVVSNINVSGMPTAGANIRLQIHNETAKTASTWAATTAYSLGDKVLRSTGLGTEQTAGLYMVCTTAGTSGGGEPTWDTVVGNTTADGTVTWTTYAILFYDADPASASYADSYTDGEEFIDGDTWRVRFAEMNGATSFKTYENTGLVGSTGFSVVVSVTADSVYATNAIDGSSTTVTNKFTADFTNNEIDLDTNTDFKGTEAYAYYCYELTESNGMYTIWGAMTALDESNYRNEVSIFSIFLDETAGFVKQTDSVRLFRSDGTRPARDPTTGGNGVEVNWRNPVYGYDAGGGGFTASDRATLDAAATQASVNTIDSNVDAILLDTADMQPKLGTPASDISADIAAVKAETALIVADTNELQGDWVDGGRLDLILDARASQSSVDGLNDISAADVNAQCDTAISDASLATAASVATVDSNVDAIKAKTDQLTFTKANELDTNIQSVNDVTVTGTGADGDEWGS